MIRNYSKLFRKTYQQEFSFRRVQSEKVSRHPVRDLRERRLKVRNGFSERRREREEELSVVSVKMMI